MYTQRKGQRAWVPVTVALFVAITGQTVVVFNDFGPSNHSRASASARVVTAEAVSRAGAVQIPSQPPARRPVSSTRLASTLLSDTSRG
jgi:hypothetical protein